MTGTTDSSPNSPVRSRRFLAITSVCLILIVVLFPLFGWRYREIDKAESLSNLRRLADGLQLYAQDYDGCLMPPVTRQANGYYLLWTDRLKGYSPIENLEVNPSNPVMRSLTDPLHLYRVPTSYALNRRFYGVFSAGPFSTDNLELPEQTALLVEAGPMWNHTGRSGEGSPAKPYIAQIFYSDTTKRVDGLVPYPSTHIGHLALVAADGHAAAIKVAHYGPQDGPHDTLYGRIGGSIYNWNGGHPNGQTDTPPHE